MFVECLVMDVWQHVPGTCQAHSRPVRISRITVRVLPGRAWAVERAPIHLHPLALACNHHCQLDRVAQRLWVPDNLSCEQACFGN